MSPNLSAKAIQLRMGEKSLRDNVPIRFNEWTNARAPPKDTVPKSAQVKFSILTHNHGVGGSGKFASQSFGARTSLKLSQIEDNPKATIEVWQSIFNELLPALIDVSPITAVELFQSHLTGTAAKEFEQICYDAAGDLYENTIQPKFNKMLDDHPMVDFVNARKPLAEINSLPTTDLREGARALYKWALNNETRKTGRSSVPGVATYTIQTKPERFPKPPAKPSKGKFAGWNELGVAVMSPCAWLRLHNHGWEFAEDFFKLCFKQVQLLAFKSYGKHAGRTQIDYLTEDLVMDKNHTLKTFFRLVQAHSEAQPYYPPLQMDQEVGNVFSDSRKVQIVWNAANGIFHDELVNLNITRMDDFNGDYETCKVKLLLAEQHFQTRQAKAKAKQDPGNGKSGKEKYKNKGGKNANANKNSDKNPNSAGTPLCGYCGGAHWRVNCFKDPQGPNFKGGSKPGNAANNTGKSQNRNSQLGKRGRGELMTFEEFQENEESIQKKYQSYIQDQSQFPEV